MEVVLLLVGAILGVIYFTGLLSSVYLYFVYDRRSSTGSRLSPKLSLKEALELIFLSFIWPIVIVSIIIILFLEDSNDQIV